MHTDGVLEDMIDYDDHDMIDRLDMTVHDVSSQIASEINNQGQWIDFLLENGWGPDDIARIIRG
jgi:hypothetical protein